MSVYKNAGLLILGTRLKRMSERFLSEVSKIYKEQKIEFEPTWFPILFLLDTKGPVSLTEMAQELEVSHSAVSQMVSQLQLKNIVETLSELSDARVKRIYFTSNGRALMEQTHAVWKALAQSLDLMLSQPEQSAFLASLSTIEDKIASGFLSSNTLELLTNTPFDIECRLADAKTKDKLQKWILKNDVTAQWDNCTFAVAFHRAQIVGYVAYSQSNAVLQLKHVFVLAEHRQKGIATQLLNVLHSSQSTPGSYFQLEATSLELIQLLLKLNYSFKVN